MVIWGKLYKFVVIFCWDAYSCCVAFHAFNSRVQEAQFNNKKRKKRKWQVEILFYLAQIGLIITIFADAIESVREI